MAELTDLASLKRAFYRLTGTSASDGALSEHDETADETVEQYLQYGAWDAQEFLIRIGLADRWVSTTAALTFSGTDSADGGRYTDLPTDFLRAAGDKQYSTLRRPNGQKWGQEIPWDLRHSYGPNGYYYQNEKLWITKASNPPVDLVLDYHARIAELVDDTTVDFPTDDRALIVAYAAYRAMTDAWLPDMAMRPAIMQKLRARQQAAKMRQRRSGTPRGFRPKPMWGNHYITGGP